MELLIKNLLTEKHPQLINNSFLMQTVPDYGERSKSTPNSFIFLCLKNLGIKTGQ